MQRIIDALKQEEANFTLAIKETIARLDEVVYPLGEYVVMAGGKRLRPLLAMLSAKIFGCTHPDVYIIGAAIECLHSATLLHDDILDSANTRRGKVAAHKIFGITETVLSGDVLCALAIKIVAEMNDPRLTCILADALSHTASGQVAELGMLHSVESSEEAYLKVITGKTAWLIRCACEMGAMRAGASDQEIAALGLFGLELGRAFQLVDDALDIAPEENTGKPTGGDLREGKLTPPVRFYLSDLARKSGKDSQIYKNFVVEFTSGSFAPGRIEEITREMRESGCDARTRSLAELHLEKASAALTGLPDNAVRSLLSIMPDYIQNRDS